MWIFNSAFGKIFDALFLPFRDMSPWVGMILVSFLTGLLMLFVFKWTSNQQGIQKVKNRIKAHLLELRLFKDSLSQSLRSQGNILRCNLKYISYSAKPMLVMILPLILIIIQLNFWFGYESLTPNESTILKIKLAEDQNPLEAQIAVQPSSGLVMETLPLRIEESQEINWRFSATQGGMQEFTVTIDGETVTKKVAVAQKPLSKISPQKPDNNFLDQVLYPVEAPIKSQVPIKTIEIQYPSKSMNLFGWEIHWIIAYFVLSIIFGFAFKGVFKVQI
ncbi:MAG: hypothetical protein JSV17_07150 [Candidatus Aminicenantes bacterium]|nr:MAG: hypothetical protein JSV17_07150 [Candidatus Aminicenantes bacterium]